MDTVMRLLEELEDILDSSRALPFSNNKVAVDKDELYDIVAELRECLPNDIKQSKIIVQERNKIIIEAQKEAEGIAKDAEEKMRRLIDEHEITKAACAQSTELVEMAKKQAKEMRIGATEYADSILAAASSRLQEMRERMREESIKLDEFFGQSLDVIYENRQELRGINKM
ncbi:MAG: ATPase [Firmicutes bacterium]|nr:ATPase [Bacillota bacterium]